MTKSMLHRFAIVVVAAALGSAAIATDAVARGGGGAGHGGGVGGGHFGGERLAGKFEHGPHGRARGAAVPFGYYDDGYSGYYDPSTVTPDEQPSGPTTPYAQVQPSGPTAPYALVQPSGPTTPYAQAKPPRSSCSTQTYKVPSEAGGEASINIVRC
jgi:hypothetical protein